MDDKRKTFESWKEIAAYLKRTERTCRSMELRAGLPVHRFDGSPKARVFAFKDEIDAWLEKKRDGRGDRSSVLVRYALGAALFAASLLLLWFLIVNHGKEPEAVAVLPFSDLSPAGDQAVWCEGIAETVLNALAREKGLQVRSRFSSFLFKSSDDLRAVGRKLKVQKLVIGSLSRQGDRARIAVQLIDSADGTPVWSENYDRKMNDIFIVEDEIVRAVLEALNVGVSMKEGAHLVGPRTRNLEAHCLYLQGWHFWNKRGRDDLFKSVACFEKALALEPRNALAQAGLAAAYCLLGNSQILPSRDSYPRGKELALGALKIDDRLALVYANLAMIKLDYEWDFAGAEEDIDRCIKLDPGNGYAHHARAIILSFKGRHAEAIREIKLARDLDPLAPRIRANVGYLLYNARRFNEAAAELGRALDFDPSHAAIYEYLGDVNRETGHYGESIAWFMRARDLEDRPHFTLKLALSMALAGKADDAKALIKELEERSKKEYVSPALLGVFHAALGESDAAFALMDQACAERDIKLRNLKTEPIYDPLRSDPRFKALLKKVGF